MFNVKILNVVTSLITGACISIILIISIIVKYIYLYDTDWNKCNMLETTFKYYNIHNRDIRSLNKV